MVAYNNKKYYIDIIETKPSNAITIIETDCEVDFAPPLDYKEPERSLVPTSSSKALSQGEKLISLLYILQWFILLLTHHSGFCWFILISVLPFLLGTILSKCFYNYA